MAAAFISLFARLGFFALADPAATAAAVLTVSAAATAVESLPANAWVDDNVSVPVVAAGLGWWLLARGG